MHHRADYIFILNFPPAKNVYRIFKRYWQYRLFHKKRIGLHIANANVLHWSFVMRTLFWRKNQLPRIYANIQHGSLTQKTIQFTSNQALFNRITAIIAGDIRV